MVGKSYLLNGAVLACLVLIGSVSSCDVNCATGCVKYTGCDGVCKPLYGIDYSTAAHNCGPCEPLCLSACNTKGVGTCDNKCQTGYCVNFTDGHCYTKANCVNCSTATSMNCTGCEPGYVAYQTNCAKCGDNCTVPCTYPGSCPLGKCTAPEFGSLLITGTTYYKCAPCDLKCTGGCTTKGAGKCDSVCITGYGVDASFTCQPCDVNCAGVCTVKKAGKCDATCNSGYGLNTTTYNCVLCDVKCTSGCNLKGGNKCDSTCTSGFGIDASFTCQPCDANCAGVCDVKHAGKCDATCQTGFSLGTSFNCVVCDPHCGTGCDKNMTCPYGQCATGYGSVLLSGSTTDYGCAACDANCAGTCNLHGAGTCDSTCKTGFTFGPTSFHCVVCDPHCGVACEKNLTCPSGKCMSGYGSVLLTGSTTDYGCVACERLCIGTCSASGGGMCDDLCYAGYCPNPADHHCTAVSHCVSCQTSSLSCNVCETGYSAVGGSCILCDNNCAVSCTVVDTCPPGGCKDPGYGSMPLTGSTQTTCAPCDVNCAGSCKVNGGGKCDGTCKAGYALNPTTLICQACGSNCLGGCTGYGPGFCDGPCKVGYVLMNAIADATKKACYPCALHCSSVCTTEGRGCCDSTCATGYTWTLSTSSPLCHVCV